MRMRSLALLVSVAGLLAACGDGSQSKALPRLDYVNFVAALHRLHGAGFKVAVPYFPAFESTEMTEQGRGRLSHYVVVRARRLSGDTVALTLALPRFEGPMGSLVAVKGEPRYLSTPNLVARSYESVAEKSEEYTQRGYWLRISTVAPLPRSGADVGEDFRIASQLPSPGTRIPFGGLVRRGIRPRSSTITVSLTNGGTTTAAQASARARRALRSAAVLHLGPFPRAAAAESCRIREGGPSRKFVAGQCFAGVDLSGEDPVVVYRELWDGRDFRGEGAPARPDLEHVWEVTVSRGGKVLSVHSFGAFPPQLVR
jgi:hypothetical protein